MKRYILLMRPNLFIAFYAVSLTNNIDAINDAYFSTVPGTIVKATFAITCFRRSRRTICPNTIGTIIRPSTIGENPSWTSNWRTMTSRWRSRSPPPRLQPPSPPRPPMINNKTKRRNNNEKINQLFILKLHPNIIIIYHHA